jgi:hypothetical protein
MKLSIDGKIPREFWIGFVTLCLVLVGTSHETIIEVIV